MAGIENALVAPSSDDENDDGEEVTWAEEAVASDTDGDDQKSSKKGKGKKSKSKKQKKEKRQRDGDNNNDDDDDDDVRASASSSSSSKSMSDKKRARLTTMKEKRREMSKVREEEAERVENKIEMMDTTRQAHTLWEMYVNGLQSQGGVKLSPIECDEQHSLNRSHFVRLSGADTSRAHEMQRLADHVKNAIPQWKRRLQIPPSSKKGPRGAPVVLVITASAIRATQVVKVLSTIGGKSGQRVSKLWSRHMKVKDQQEVLKTFITTMAVGTPNRLQKLLDLGALSLHQLELCILDCQPAANDGKQVHLLNMHDVSRDFFHLMHSHLLKCIVKSNSSSSSGDGDGDGDGDGGDGDAGGKTKDGGGAKLCLL